jgi:hypothetical protein
VNVVSVPSVGVTETRTTEIDFSPYLFSGQTISAARATCTVFSGTDANPAAFVTTTTPDSPYVYVTTRVGIEGVIYQIVVEVDTLVVTSPPIPAGTLAIAFHLAVTPSLV